MRPLSSLISLLAATAARVSASPAPAPTIPPAAGPGPGPGPALGPAPGPHHHHDARQQQTSTPTPSPSPFPTHSPTHPPLPTHCLPSLTALLSALPTPPTTPNPALRAWALASAPIQLIASAALSNTDANNHAYPAALGLDDSSSDDINAMCTRAATPVTAPPALAGAYAEYLDAVQMWRFGVEGDAYRLARECGYEVGLGVELLMATEAAMCVSGLRASVVPWKTQGVVGSGNAAAPRVMGVGGVGVAVGVVAVVVVVGGL